MANKRFNYVVIGAGSAGAIVAARLSEDPNVTVALIEAGGSDRSLFIRMPTALSIPMNMPKYNWGYESNPEPFVNNRRLDCPRGKVLGGSSSINGMAFVRGNPRDFDQWEACGAAGWNYASCLPYFKKMESWMHGADEYRGGAGPIHVNAGNNMALNPLYQAFIDAGIEAGYPHTQDYNGHQQEGFGQKHMNVAKGVRQSTAFTYLKAARHRPNLTVLSHALVDKILFSEDASEPCAVGVRYQSAGRTIDVMASEEVICCAGSIGSPSVLQRSGIGPAAVLEEAGVAVRLDSPGVGENLQDHLEVYWSKALIGARWVLSRKGLGATNHFESCGFIRSRAGLQQPNIQYHFLPGAMRYDGRAAFEGDGYQVHVGPNKPHSRGCVAIRSTNPAEAPSRGNEIQPGMHVESDEQIDEWVRANVESAYHPSCSVKLGADDDPMAVLNGECRVRGVQNLRVVDSSIFPTITNGNLNAPTMMVAERAADLIRGRSLPPESAPVWTPNHWQEAQRSNIGQ